MPPTSPQQIRILGPVAGYTVNIKGAPVFSDPHGTPVAMPHTPHIWQSGDAAAQGGVAVEGRTTYYVDHVRGTPVHLGVTVTAADGTTLIDWYGATAPILVDALDRLVTPLDPDNL